MKYRAEIDGLRALAVLPVIFFHAGFEWFSGGFVGVDVFFVISGYLITTILIEDIEKKRFSLVNFYERRARRILPALFFVMFVCIPFAWMWMLPSQMKDFSESLIAVSLFTSNILFWREGGYFAGASEEKPLLHTWSLAVEEQYYLLFPIFLLLAWRFGKNRVFWTVVIFAAISLALSEWGWRNKASANFYLAPTRAWELFAGSIAAFFVLKRGVQSNNALSLLGLVAIGFSIFFYDKTTPFPSIYALVPVIGVVLLVIYADKNTLAAKLLSTKAFVGIGLISYSAYLWHQPLFAFARIYLIDYPSKLTMGILCLLTFILALGCWRHVEKPFRDKDKISPKQIFLGSSVLLSGAILFGLYGHLQDGFKFRVLSDQTDNFTQAIINEWAFSGYPSHPSLNGTKSDYYVFGEVDLDNEAVVLIGDSHALQYWYTFGELLANYPEKYTNKSVYVRKVTFGDSDLHLPVNTKTVVLSYFWALHLNNPNVNTFIRCCGEGPGGVDGVEYKPIDESELNSRYQGLIELIQNLKGRGIEVYLVLDNPFGEELNAKSLIDVNRGMGVKIGLNDFARVELSRSEAKERSEPTRSKLIDIAQDLEIIIIDPFEYLCTESLCEKYSRDGYLIYKDYDHLSLKAVSNMASYMYRALD